MRSALDPGFDRRNPMEMFHVKLKKELFGGRGRVGSNKSFFIQCLILRNPGGLSIRPIGMTSDNRCVVLRRLDRPGFERTKNGHDAEIGTSGALVSRETRAIPMAFDRGIM